MAVSRTFPGFVIYLHFKDSAFLTVKRDTTFYFRYKKGILFLMQDIRIIILKLKCWVMNLLQFSQMNWIYWFNIPSKGPSMIADIPPLKFEVSGITRLLRNINAKKARGPDNISLAGFWKKLRLSLPHFSSIFYSINTKQVKCQVTGSLQMSPQFSKKESQKAK